MEHKIAEPNARVDVADVLRGLAVMGIILLHSIEHFNFYLLSELFGGTIFVEQVFSYPGLGQATVSAGLKGDLPLLMGIAIIS